MMDPGDYYLRLNHQAVEEKIITKDESLQFIAAFKRMRLSPEQTITQLEMIVIARASAMENAWFYEGVNRAANNPDNPINQALNVRKKN